MAFFALISWLRNPYKGNRAEVQVNRLKKAEILFMAVLTGVITFIFYYILAYFHTSNLLLSTVSITTSFIAVYLTYRRNAYFAAAYAANDIVLILLWGIAALSNRSYLSVLVCFIVFLINDIYGFINWKKMQKRQNQNNCNGL